MRPKTGKDGFTLAELLIVVAIIAVLVAVALPIFTSQLEKSREAADVANIRSAYAELCTQVIDGNYSAECTVALVQREDGWTNEDLSEVLSILGSVEGEPTALGSCVLSYDQAEEVVLISFDGTGAGGGGKTHSSSPRRELMKSIAGGLKKGLGELIPDGKHEQALSCLHHDDWTASNGDHVVVNELNISESNLNAGVYWNPSKHTWGELLTEAGVDYSQLGNQNGYVYLDSSLNPVSVSYYDEDSNYCYTFISDGVTVKMDRMPGERQHAGYFEDYAKSIGTVID